MTTTSKRQTVDLKAAILQALTDEQNRLLRVLPFKVYSLDGFRMVLFHPKKFSAARVGSDVSPHQLAECVAVVRGDNVVIAFQSANFKAEWSALSEL